MKLPQTKRRSKRNVQDLPPIPQKLYFTIGEASSLCLVKPYVLRYWEREFPQLRPTKRRGNRRYYQRNEIMLIRRIKSLLYVQGYTIEGAREAFNNDTQSSCVPTSNKEKLASNVLTKLSQIVTSLA